MRVVNRDGDSWDLEDDPFSLPDYVRQALEAWCRANAERKRQRDDEHASEYDIMRNDPSYDPQSDWLDEPFPEENY